MWTIFNLQASTRLSYENVHYFSPSSSLNSTSWLSLDFLKEWIIREDLSAYIDAKVSMLNAPYSIYKYYLPQFYVTFHGNFRSSVQIDLSLGKKLLNWYFAEHFWSLDDINAFSLSSLFDKRREGSVGFHIDATIEDRLHVHMTTSFLHWPVLTPSYRVEDGNITPDEHWLKKKYPSRVNILNQDYNVYYQVKDFLLSDMILQKTLGLKVRYDLTSNSSLSTFFLIGPEHNLRTNINAYLDKYLNKVVVDIYPFVNQRLSYGLTYSDSLKNDIDVNIGLKVKDSNYHSNYFFPESKEKHFKANNYELKPIFNSSALFNVAIQQNKEYYQLSFNYIQQLNSIPKSSFEKLERWYKAIGFFGEYKINDRFQVSLDIKQDLVLEDLILINEYNYQLAKNMDLTLGMELIHSHNQDSYWYDYRENDTIYSLFTYKI